MAHFKAVMKNWGGVLIAIVLLAIYVLYWWLYCPRLMTAVFLFLAVPLLIITILSSFGKLKMGSNGLYLSLLLTLGLFFCFVFPPMKVPDEPFHYLSTQWIVNLITGRGTASSGTLLRGDEWLLYSKFNSSRLSSGDYATVAKDFTFLCTDTSSRLVGQSFDLNAVNPSAKIFTILGLLIAKCLNLGAYPSFYLGRLFSLGFFVASAYGAYMIAPKGKAIIAYVSLLPMSLHLAASYSYDCGIIAYSLLIFAFLMRGFFGEEGGIGIKAVCIYCLVAALLAPCKVIYSCLCLLGLFIPSSKFSNQRFARLSKVALLAAVSLAVVLIRLASVMELAAGSDSSDRGEESGHMYTIAGIIRHPVQSFRMLVRTLDSLGDFYWESTLGYCLGWLQGEISMPAFFMIPYLAMGAICCFEDEYDSASLPRYAAVCFVGAFVLIVLAAMLSMWIGWTYDTEAIIQGVQGRYFLPALPALLIALRDHKFSFRGNALQFVICGMGVMNFLYVIRLFCIAASL